MRVMQTMGRSAVGLATAAVLAVGLAGCSSSVPKDEVEEQASKQLEDEVGAAPKSLSCPEDLPAEKDEEIRCDLVTPDDETYGTTVTVTSVDGSDVKFDIQVDEKAK